MGLQKPGLSCPQLLRLALRGGGGGGPGTGAVSPPSGAGGPALGGSAHRE